MDEYAEMQNTGDLPGIGTLEMHIGEKRKAEVEAVFEAGGKGKLGQLLLESLFCQ